MDSALKEKRARPETSKLKSVKACPTEYLRFCSFLIPSAFLMMLALSQSALTGDIGGPVNKFLRICSFEVLVSWVSVLGGGSMPRRTKADSSQ